MRKLLLAGIGVLALSGCVVAVTETARPTPMAAMPMAPPPDHPPLQHGPIVDDAPHGISQARLAVLDSVMKQYVADGKLAGAVLKIHQDGREVFNGVYGWRDREANAQRDGESGLPAHACILLGWLVPAPLRRGEPKHNSARRIVGRVRARPCGEETAKRGRGIRRFRLTFGPVGCSL